MEVGRLDIGYEVSALFKFLVCPRTGHLLQALHISKYLEIHKENDLAFDPLYHYVDSDETIKERVASMRDLYCDAVEDLPPNVPKQRGNARISQTGILLYYNSAPTTLFSKRQNTVESSTFGSEFVALRVASEMILSVRYKLRMFSIPIDGPANVFCDNE